MNGQFEIDEVSQTLDEWEATQTVGTGYFKKQGLGLTVMPTKLAITTFPKKPITCFHCGKFGHMSRESRSRLAGERQTQQPGLVKTEPQSQSMNTTPVRPVKREVTCFTCQQKGHSCLNARKDKVRLRESRSFQIKWYL